MKKLLLVLAIGAFVACNDSGSGETPGGDSTATNAAPEQTPPANSDSTANAADSTAADSTMMK